jgi:hypothetical protein
MEGIMGVSATVRAARMVAARSTLVTTARAISSKAKTSEKSVEFSKPNKGPKKDVSVSKK